MTYGRLEMASAWSNRRHFFDLLGQCPHDLRNDILTALKALDEAKYIRRQKVELGLRRQITERLDHWSVVTLASTLL